MSAMPRTTPLSDNTLTLVRGVTYRERNVPLDGFAFEDCVFDRCLLIYTGTGGIQFTKCRFINVDWRLDGPAANTLTFLHLLANDFGEAGKSLTAKLISRVLSEEFFEPGALLAEIRANDLGTTVPQSDEAGTSLSNPNGMGPQ